MSLSNTTQLNELLALNENDIITNCSNNNTTLINKHTHHVSIDQLQNAIHELKSYKSDCTDQLFSDHFINGTLRFFTLIFFEGDRRRFITKSANNYKTVHYLQKAETQT